MSPLHPSADVDPRAKIGRGTIVWNWAKIREDAVVGEDCVIAKGVYIDRAVRIGDRVKLENGVSVFEGVTIEDGVFVGPHSCLTNDLYPRAVTEDFRLAGSEDWEIIPTLVRRGASIGANTTVIPGVTIGEYAMIGAGSVVTTDIPAYALAFGNPARVTGKVDQRGRPIPRPLG